MKIKGKRQNYLCDVTVLVYKSCHRIRDRACIMNYAKLKLPAASILAFHIARMRFKLGMEID